MKRRLFLGLLLVLIGLPSGGNVHAQSSAPVSVDFGFGGGNVGGGAVTTEAKFVGSVSVSVPFGSALRLIRPELTIAAERLFANDGPGDCTKFENGQCVARPPALTGILGFFGARLNATSSIMVAAGIGAGYFEPDQAGDHSPAVAIRAELSWRAATHVAFGVRGEDATIAHLLGDNSTIQTASLILRVW